MKFGCIWNWGFLPRRQIQGVSEKLMASPTSLCCCSGQRTESFSDAYRSKTICRSKTANERGSPPVSTETFRRKSINYEKTLQWEGTLVVFLTLRSPERRFHRYRTWPLQGKKCHFCPPDTKKLCSSWVLSISSRFSSSCSPWPSRHTWVDWLMPVSPPHNSPKTYPRTFC